MGAVLTPMRLVMQTASARPAVCLTLAFMASHAGAATPVPAAPTPAAPTPAGPPAQPVGNPVAAVWKEHHIDFFYMGRTARYSCEGLRDKVRAMLLDLGARRDLKIMAVGCDDTNRLHVNSMAPSLSVIF